MVGEGADDASYPLFPTRRRAIKGLVASAFVLALCAFVGVIGGWGARVFGAGMAVMVIWLGRGWIAGLRRTRPLLWIGDGGLRLPSGQRLGWAQVEGVVVMDVGGRWFGVVAKDAAQLDRLPVGRRLPRRIDSALAGRPVWTHLPLAVVSEEDRRIIDEALTAHNIRRLSPQRGAVGRILRALLWFMSPG